MFDFRFTKKGASPSSNSANSLPTPKYGRGRTIRPGSPTTTPSSREQEDRTPSPCNKPIDAIASIRGDIFIFKDNVIYPRVWKALLVDFSFPSHRNFGGLNKTLSWFAKNRLWYRNIFPAFPRKSKKSTPSTNAKATTRLCFSWEKIIGSFPQTNTMLDLSHWLRWAFHDIWTKWTRSPTGATTNMHTFSPGQNTGDWTTERITFYVTILGTCRFGKVSHWTLTRHSPGHSTVQPTFSKEWITGSLIIKKCEPVHIIRNQSSNTGFGHSIVNHRITNWESGQWMLPIQGSPSNTLQCSQYSCQVQFICDSLLSLPPTRPTGKNA